MARLLRSRPFTIAALMVAGFVLIAIPLIATRHTSAPVAFAATKKKIKALGSGATISITSPTPETATAASPLSGKSVSVTVSLSGSLVTAYNTVDLFVDDDSGDTNPNLRVPSAQIGALFTAPYTFRWDTTQFLNGPHKLIARVWYYGSVYSRVEVDNIYISNPGTPIMATITSPKDGDTIGGIVPIVATVTNTRGTIDNRRLIVDNDNAYGVNGENILLYTQGMPGLLPALTEGTHTLKYRVWGYNGCTFRDRNDPLCVSYARDSDPITITVRNTDYPLQVTITNPTSGGSVATDPYTFKVKVTQGYKDGSNVEIPLSSVHLWFDRYYDLLPNEVGTTGYTGSGTYTFPFNFNGGVSNGSHFLDAEVFDTAGHGIASARTTFVLNIPAPACKSNWLCQWSACINGVTSKTCTDTSRCSVPTSAQPPTERKSCSDSVPCQAKWTCGTWSACVSGSQRRSCTQTNSCPTDVSAIPALTQSCSGGTGTADSTAPKVAIGALPLGPVRGVVSVPVTATDNIGVLKVVLMVDSKNFATSYTPPYTFSINTSALSAGSHSLQAVAYDAAGNKGTSDLAFLTLAQPGEDGAKLLNSVISDIRALSTNKKIVVIRAAIAESNPKSVDFYSNGLLIGRSTTSPYTLQWKLDSGVFNGGHWFYAIVRTASGRSVITPTVAYTLQNPLRPAKVILLAPKVNSVQKTSRLAVILRTVNGEAISKILIRVDGKNAGSVKGKVGNANQVFRFSTAINKIKRGKHTLKLTAVDASGATIKSLAVQFRK